MTWTIIATVLGIVSTVIAWRYNPRRIIQAELDSISTKLSGTDGKGGLYALRDKALVVNDSDTLTIVDADIDRLCARQAVLLQRLGQSSR